MAPEKGASKVAAGVDENLPRDLHDSLAVPASDARKQERSGASGDVAPDNDDVAGVELQDVGAIATTVAASGRF